LIKLYCLLLSGGFRHGLGAQPPPSFSPGPPSFVATHVFFAKITQISDFFAFTYFSKVGKFAASTEHLKTKNASATKGFAPPPDQRLCPWTLRPDTCYSSAVQPAAHGPHVAREGISCGLPSPHINCSFGPVISQMKSTCKIQQCLMVFCVSTFQKNG